MDAEGIVNAPIFKTYISGIAKNRKTGGSLGFETSELLRIIVQPKVSGGPGQEWSKGPCACTYIQNEVVFRLFEIRHQTTTDSFITQQALNSIEYPGMRDHAMKESCKQTYLPRPPLEKGGGKVIFKASFNKIAPENPVLWAGFFIEPVIDIEGFSKFEP